MIRRLFQTDADRIVDVEHQHWRSGHHHLQVILPQNRRRIFMVKPSGEIYESIPSGNSSTYRQTCRRRDKKLVAAALKLAKEKV